MFLQDTSSSMAKLLLDDVFISVPTEKRKDGNPLAFSRRGGKVAAQGRLAGRQRMFLMP